MPKEVNASTDKLLIECQVAITVLMEGKCGCESGGSWGPEFVCGFHSLLNRIADVVGEPPDVEELDEEN